MKLNLSYPLQDYNLRAHQINFSYTSYTRKFKLEAGIGVQRPRLDVKSFANVHAKIYFGPIINKKITSRQFERGKKKMNLWLLLVLEPSVVNSLSLVKASGEIEATMNLDQDREVNFVNFICLMLIFKLQDCGDRPTVFNGNYIQPSKSEAYKDQDQLELQCRKL